jgi:hypothetical protein
MLWIYEFCIGVDVVAQILISAALYARKLKLSQKVKKAQLHLRLPLAFQMPYALTEKFRNVRNPHLSCEDWNKALSKCCITTQKCGCCHSCKALWTSIESAASVLWFPIRTMAVGITTGQEGLKPLTFRSRGLSPPKNSNFTKWISKWIHSWTRLTRMVQRCMAQRKI